jgi:hypothetical protein
MMHHGFMTPTKNGIIFQVIMKRRKVKKAAKRKERLIFDSIRKPIAPPTRKFGSDKPDEKAMPSGRKAKHKKADLDE